ncbi:MAG: helix-turn-helix domain-containing protein [Micrococcaceae bacterium]
MPTKLLSVQEAAERLGENPQTTKRRLRRGEIRGTRLSTGRTSPWRVTEKALEAFIQRRTQ